MLSGKCQEKGEVLGTDLNPQGFPVAQECRIWLDLRLGQA